jgi:adenylate cyclase class IV
MEIEVESKFRLPATWRQDLVSTGAILLHVSTFTDTYIDRPDFDLLRRDTWLRQRLIIHLVNK